MTLILKVQKGQTNVGTQNLIIKEISELNKMIKYLILAWDNNENNLDVIHNSSILWLL